MSEKAGGAGSAPLRGGPLTACLVALAKAHGIRTSESTLLAGLPLQQEQLTPSLFDRAATRAGLASQLSQRPLAEINQALLPAILILENNNACLLVELNVEQGTADVVFPELGKTVSTVSLAELDERYAGRVIYARPKINFRARNAGIHEVVKGHWFWDVIKSHRSLFRDVLLAAFMINLFALVMPLFVMNVYDRVVPNFATETLWVLAIGVAVVLVADVVLKIVRAWFVDLAASRIDIRLSANIMARVLGMKLSEQPSSVGSFASGLQAFESVRAFIGSSTIIAFIDLPFVVVFLLVIGLLTSWWLTIPIIVGALICLIYAASVQTRMHQLSLATMEASGQRNSVLVESLNSLESLKFLGAEGRMQQLWERATVFLSRTSTKTRLLSGSVTAGSQSIQQLVAVSIIIVGVYLIADGQLSQGGLIAAYMLSSRIMAPIGQSAGLMMQYHQAATALEGVEQVMNKPVERPEDSQWVNVPRVQGRVEFKKVSFRYPNDDRDILKDVSFVLEPGERVAVLGRNGSGKTTIQKLIAGLYSPSAGNILIDNIDIGQLDPAQLRENIGYVPQDINLFLGTLRENLALAHPHVDDARLMEVIELCGLTEFINAHPQGLSMPVGERGGLLSGGQKQSVAVARALMSEPSVLLLDEPTGAMDHSSEEALKTNLVKPSTGKTMLVITHRTSLLTLVDRIIVIDAGKIVADGPKDQVVEALRQGRIGRAG
ncbi:type I secretion system permease/ATPase [Gilvimarinus sp. SDUM040013]|uniref:Type I secretion system permease/ATPase n=1 Tax=Gilvimarinus gilvus TaxID=3058038 RepID=A0ABU4S3V7_9GAMM|nr:type I secretion system permease/ATPase [Gilvimarinus sp. SDUM040013]MDO3384359.1 type I secretion system permease/ATPase [Gilvimarinus sp. SDUM040013]MDX6851207.1 type I secretion system permease/ATPase [Gilvimarinus sp. SDUM040013]